MPPSYRSGLRGALAVVAISLMGHSSQAAAPLPNVRQAPLVANLHGPDGPGTWDYASIDTETKRLLVARMTCVEAVNLSNERPGSCLAEGRHVHAVLPLPGDRLLFTNGDTRSASLVARRSGALLTTFKTGPDPDGAVFDPASGQALVMDGGDGTVTRIDAMGNRPHVVGVVKVGGKLEAAALDGKRRLFVNVENQNQIAVVSLATGAVVQRYLLSGCQAPTGLGYSKEHALLVSACTNGVIKVLDDEGIERANLSVGPHPDAVIEDASRDRMFIPSGGDGSLSEIILSPTPHINRIWATKLGARTGAFDPRRQRIYLPYGDTIRLKGQKAKLVPGSFGILVIDVH